MVASYYEVLGVAPSASPDEIRRAYRHQARALHPDHQARSVSLSGGEVDATLRAMQVLNEAWRVLGDRERRVAYDRLLAGPNPGPGVGREPMVEHAEPPFLAPGSAAAGVGVALARGLPWVAVLVVLGVIFVFTAFAGSPGDPDRAPTASDLVGSCVQLERGGVVRRVPCDGPSDGRVDLVAARASLCPHGADIARLASQESWLCLRDPSAG